MSSFNPFSTPQRHQQTPQSPFQTPQQTPQPQSISFFSQPQQQTPSFQPQQFQQQQQQQQSQQQLYLFTNDQAPASYSTEWSDLHPDSQKLLLGIEKKILEYTSESLRLDQCSRLYDSSIATEGFEFDASRIVQELGGINATMDRQKAVLHELMLVVENIHQYIGSMRTAYLADQRRRGECNDPFLEADRRETAKQEAAAKRVHPTLHLPAATTTTSTSTQASTQVTGLITSSGVSNAPQTPAAFPTSGAGLFPDTPASVPSSSLFATPVRPVFGAPPASGSLFGQPSPSNPATPSQFAGPSPGSGAKFSSLTRPSRFKSRTSRR
ncbi:unnamed protein product [Brassica oleracea var. botrytis]